MKLKTKNTVTVYTYHYSLLSLINFCDSSGTHMLKSLMIGITELNCIFN